MDGVFIHSGEFIQIKAAYVKGGYIASDFFVQTVCVCVCYGVFLWLYLTDWLAHVTDRTNFLTSPFVTS